MGQHYLYPILEGLLRKEVESRAHQVDITTMGKSLFVIMAPQGPHVLTTGFIQSIQKSAKSTVDRTLNCGAPQAVAPDQSSSSMCKVIRATSIRCA